MLDRKRRLDSVNILEVLKRMRNVQHVLAHAVQVGHPHFDGHPQGNIGQDREGEDEENEFHRTLPFGHAKFHARLGDLHSCKEA